MDKRKLEELLMLYYQKKERKQPLRAYFLPVSEHEESKYIIGYEGEKNK